MMDPLKLRDSDRYYPGEEDPWQDVFEAAYTARPKTTLQIPDGEPGEPEED